MLKGSWGNKLEITSDLISTSFNVSKLNRNGSRLSNFSARDIARFPGNH